MKNRMTNPWFWVGLGGIVLSASGISPETLTSWPLVGDALLTMVSNPVTLVGIAMSVLGVFVDPTTDGLGDSL
ncbi:MAG: phage holin [Eubacteriales bacterium]